MKPIETEKINKIGAFEAKTRLSELLRQTEQGRSFVIMRRGKAVARLIPIEEGSEQELEKVKAAFAELRKQIKRPFSVGEIRALIAEGRRY